MISKKMVWIAFALLVLLQLWVPASVIRNRENVLSTGKPFKFRTAPRDPNDYLRGKYIFLNFNENEFPVKDGKEWKRGEDIYVGLGTDSAGFAKIISIASGNNEIKGDYIKTRVEYMGYTIPKTVIIEWPFERFYMEESKAPLAEIAYNKVRVDSSMIGYALVKVKAGDAVLENVYINDKPIDSYINK